MLLNIKKYTLLDVRIALYQPDIPQNTGNICRLAACFNIPVEIIEPIGFFMDSQKFRRSAMDYYKFTKIKRHIDWNSFYDWAKNNNYRLVLLTTKGKKKYTSYKFRKNDLIIFGRESAGMPKKLHGVMDERLVIPIKKNLRSLNISSAVAITIGECMRQLKFF